MQADPAVLDQLTMLGRDGGGGGAVGNNAQMFVDLKPHGSGPGQRAEGIKQVVERLSKQYDRMPGVKVSVSAAQFRSEEHTSELQSLMRISYAVFCLKKKKK